MKVYLGLIKIKIYPKFTYLVSVRHAALTSVPL